MSKVEITRKVKLRAAKNSNYGNPCTTYSVGLPSEWVREYKAGKIDKVMLVKRATGIFIKIK